MLNFNVDPYYDDFDPNKNFHRILFRPGRAVQGRELTQSQTILQNQISNFADHFFNQNTPIKGGNVTINTKVKYIKLNPTFQDNDVTAADFLNQIITDDTGTIFAQVLSTEESVGTDPPTLVVSYFSGGEFANGSNVISQTSSSIAQAIASDATGTASVASIANGIFYVVNGYNYSSVQNPDGTYSQYSIGNFVQVQPQTIVLGKYTNTPNVRVGLEISEFISDYVTDASLLDPAIGATNYQAPGADRYTITLDLTTKSLTDTTINDQNFIELVRIENGTIVRQVNETSYSAIDDYFAKRTYETNGDYIVKNFKIDAYANNVPGGTDKYVLTVGPGVAYVQGYRAENQYSLRLDGNRARTTASVNNNTINPSYGTYFYVDTLLGANGSFIDFTQSDLVDFHLGNVATVNTQTTIAYASTVAANGRVRSIQYQGSSNTDSTNTISYIYKAHVYDITSKELKSNATSASATTITFYDTNANKFSPQANIYTGTSIILTSGPGQGDIRNIIEYDGSTKTATVDAPFSTTPTGNTNFTLKFGINNINSIIKSAPGISSNLVVYGQATIDLLSKSGSPATLSSPTVLTDDDEPQMIFEVGQAYVSTMSDSSYQSLQEYRGTAFGTTTGGIQGQISMSGSFSSVANFIRTGSTESADSIKENFIVIVTDPKTNSTIAKGDIVHFTNSPTRTVTVDASKETATFFASDLDPFDGTVFAKVNIINADNSSVIRRTKTLVEANTTSLGIAGASGIVNGVYIDLVKGQIYIPNPPVDGYTTPQSLYVTDVKRIRKIINVGTATPVLADYSDTSKDVTSSFILDKGQRDSFYDHANIRLRSGAPKVGGLWILFDYYAHSGGDGYFNINSYTNETYTQIPSYTNSKNTTYQLRDCIDFRPSRVNATSNFTFKYSVTPTGTNQYGSLLPIDTSAFTNDYSFYLGRKDLLTLTKDAEFVLAEGVPSVNPQFPPDPSNGLVVARLTHDPYTAFVPNEIVTTVPNLLIVPVQHKNWQMKDITTLNERINNIEYYSTLNLLEQNSSTLQIPDALGLNRFKNGLLVDNFSTFGVADTFNRDFLASINTRKGVLEPAKNIRNFQLVNSATLNNKNFGALSSAAQTSAGYKLHKNGNSFIITLPYTEEPIVKQTLASRSQDVNAFSSWNVEGFIELSPPMDNWIETVRAPSLLFVDPNLRTYQAINNLQLVQEGDWQSIPGTKVTGEKVYETQYTGYRAISESRSATDYYGNYSLTNNLTATYVTNVSLISYIRQQQIQFVGSGFKTNTKVNAYFNDARVSRRIRRPNVLRCTSITGQFRAGDIVGYKPTSTSFVKTGKILSVTNLSSTSQILYVVDDLDSTSYTTGSFTTLYNATFDASGTYVSSSASVSASNITQTHYAGKINSPAGPSLATNLVTLDAKASSVNDYYTGMFFNVVTGSFIGMTSIGYGGFVKITAYNGTTKVATLGGNISYSNGDVYSIGESNNNEITTDEAGNVSGVFYVPPGLFPVGERVFRLDDRYVQYLGSSKFINYPGTEKTYGQATFYAQGLVQKVVDVEYSPSVSTAKGVTTQTRYNTFAIDRTYFDDTPAGPPEPPSINYDAGVYDGPLFLSDGGDTGLGIGPGPDSCADADAAGGDTNGSCGDAGGGSEGAASPGGDGSEGG